MPAPTELEPKPATPHTEARHAAALAGLSALRESDAADHERATRGLVAQHPTGRISHTAHTAEAADGAGAAVAAGAGAAHLVWDVGRKRFLDGDAPTTVDPSLWRQAQLNRHHGLFEVAPGLWQARGYDISNVSFVAGERGWIVIDPLTSEACARACLELANEHLGRRPVTAVIYTHSHGDHFGGVLGVTTREAVRSGECRVIAPEGFLHEAVAENLLAGPAMGRRATYQFGTQLPPGPRGHVDAGLGPALPVEAPTLIGPTEEVTATGQELVVDGVRIVFQLTPETEAPAEMCFFFPDRGWFCSAEVCTHTMHNLVPIRGAQVRNSLRWSEAIDEAIGLFGEDLTLMFASHHWPRWGRDDVLAYLELQRDLYRWMHDQALRWANHGLTPREIAERVRLPPEFEAQSHSRGYYGALVHNVKAVYQRYLSWYDGNPAHLDPHPPVEAGRRYVACMGGADAVLRLARDSFAAGDYRWVAELVDHLVFADPTNVEARALQADALEQLGYQSESATFRNAYLTGAAELRSGPPAAREARVSGVAGALSVEHVFGLLGVRLRSEDVGGIRLAVNWTFTDLDGPDARWVLRLSNRTLGSTRGRHEEHAAASVTTTLAVLQRVLAGATTLADALGAGEVDVHGDAGALATVFGNLDRFVGGWGVVEP